MSRYDEDLYENPFFVTLEKNYPKLFEEATVKRWIVCIPQFSMVTKDNLQDADFKDHILIPVLEDKFQTISKHEVTIKKEIIELGKGFVKQKKVEILFEETFYNTSDESYRVLCVSEFFSREPEASLDEGTGNGGMLLKQPATYEDYMKLLWTNTSNKTKDHLDKLLHTFSTAYEKFEEESISSLADFVSAQLTRAMQVVLKDPSVKRSVKLSDTYMSWLKIAVEMYMMNITHKNLFSTITACVKSSDAEVNKMTRNLKHIGLKQLGIRQEFEENLPLAKMELAKLNHFSTPLGRLFCLKKVVSALTRPLKNATESQDLLMTTDDFLPLLIYLIIKSEIPNWTANLMYMKHFHQAKVFEDDEFSFYLATTEAALDYLCSGKIKLENTEPVQKRAKTGDEEKRSFKRQGSGGTSSAKDKFFQYVQYGDETAVTLMLRKSASGTSNVLSRLCHPLCTCDKCSEILSKSKHGTDMVSSFSRDDMGHTALHIAAMYGQASLIDILIQHGSLPDSTDYLGCTPLHLASQKGFQNIILLLVHFGADISVVDNEGNTPLHLCAMNGHEDCVKAILFLDILKNKLNVNAKNDMGNTPLHLASKWGYEGIVKFLLDTEADPRIRNRKRQTPLNLAQNLVIKRELQLAIDNLPPDIVTHKENETPTHPKPPPQPPPPSQSPASTSDKKESPETLSEQKPHGFEVVDVHPVVKSSLALVDNSSGSVKSPEVASLDIHDLREVERLYKAIKDKDLPLIKYYLNLSDTGQDGANSPSPEGTLCHPLCQCPKCQHLQGKSTSNLSVNCQNKKGFAPLHISIIEKNIEAFQLFLKKGAKVNVQTHKHITPLHLACYHSNIDIVKTLIQSGADVNIKDMHGEIALHLAAAKKSIEITKLLIQHSSLVSVANRDGNTPLHHACNVDSRETTQILLDAGADVGIMNRNNEIPADLAKSEEIKQLLATYSRPLRKSKSLDVKNLQISKSKDCGVDKHGQEKSDVTVKELFAALEEKDLSTLKQITSSIRSFDKEKSLKRSKTFDRSALTLDLIKIPMSIQHFDHCSLKHVDSVDKSSPMHIYKMLRSDSSYYNYNETPVNVPKTSIEQISESDNSSYIEEELKELKSLVDSEEKSGRKDNTSEIDKLIVADDKIDIPVDISRVDTGEKKTTEKLEVVDNESDQNQNDDVVNIARDSCESLLEDSYVVVKESSEKVENLTHDDVEKSTQIFSSSENLNTDSNASLFLADCEKISIDSEKLLEKDPSKHEKDIDGMSVCSNLTMEEVVIGASQSEITANDRYLEVVTKEHTDSEDLKNLVNAVDSKGCVKSLKGGDSVETENVESSSMRTMGRDNLQDKYQSEVCDRQTHDGDVERQDTADDDIRKIIDDALLEQDS